MTVLREIIFTIFLIHQTRSVSGFNIRDRRYQRLTNILGLITRVELYLR